MEISKMPISFVQLPSRVVVIEIVIFLLALVLVGLIAKHIFEITVRVVLVFSVAIQIIFVIDIILILVKIVVHALRYRQIDRLLHLHVLCKGILKVNPRCAHVRCDSSLHKYVI